MHGERKGSPVLEVEDLRVRFETHHGTVRAVDGVDFRLHAGETLGLVGESGSGKSVTNLALMGLVPSPPGVVEARTIRLDGVDLTQLSERELRKVRGNDLSMIFQDPMTSLNPFLTIGQQLVEVLEVHKKARGAKARRRCAEGLADVGIPNPERRLTQYPHELSGGMRQRVMIAMGLLCEPKVLIADEPTTALDVTIQAQILELMKALQERHGTAIILVTHDLGVVAGMSDRVHVMYAGRLVETAATEDLFGRPLHPYTRGLLESVPTLTGDPDASLYSIPGQPPDLAALEADCAFRPRCEAAVAACASEVPALRALQDARAADERHVACLESERWIGSSDATREPGRATVSGEADTLRAPDSGPDSSRQQDRTTRGEANAPRAASGAALDADDTATFERPAQSSGQEQQDPPTAEEEQQR